MAILSSCYQFPIHTQQLVATKNNPLYYQLRIWSYVADGQCARRRFRIPLSVASLQPTHQLSLLPFESYWKAINRQDRESRTAAHTSVQQNVAACEHQLELTILGIVVLGAVSIKGATIARAAAVPQDPPGRGLS